MEKPVANGNGLSLCSFKPTKAASYNKSGCGFFVPMKQSLDSLSAKTLLTLDLKYYEKLTANIKYIY